MNCMILRTRVKGYHRLCSGLGEPSHPHCASGYPSKETKDYTGLYIHVKDSL
jgi:hypothetical protein